MKSTIGVLGGMGPLASAAFVRSIYGLYRGRREQELPVVLLYSNPTVGDRTASFLSGADHGPLLRDLEHGISVLIAQGADEVVVCCVTMHHLLPLVRRPLRNRVISLVDTVFEEVLESRKLCLLACTTGARKLGLFQQHSDWRKVQDRIVFPSECEQESLHDAIYAVKRHHATEPLIDTLYSIASRLNVEAIIAGCTELHLVTPAAAGPNRLNQHFELVDPLSAIAERFLKEEEHATVCA
jgi:aspartate racemase